MNPAAAASVATIAPTSRSGDLMNILIIQPVVALIAGILILIMPRLLNYIVAIYLILVGVTGLAGHLG
jgi:hypothetical protein